MAEEQWHIDYNSVDTRGIDLSCLMSGFVSPRSDSRDAGRDLSSLLAVKVEREARRGNEARRRRAVGLTESRGDRPGTPLIPAISTFNARSEESDLRFTSHFSILTSTLLCIPFPPLMHHFDRTKS